MADLNTPDHYIDDATYELLLQAIMNPVPSLDLRSQLIETLGELGSVWPASCLGPDHECRAV
tara:strand:- start:125754 stop:125939 length:186 start_codon:yes stop_codon:yes gene_type:complete